MLYHTMSEVSKHFRDPIVLQVFRSLDPQQQLGGSAAGPSRDQDFSRRARRFAVQYSGDRCTRKTKNTGLDWFLGRVARPEKRMRERYDIGHGLQQGNPFRTAGLQGRLSGRKDVSTAALSFASLIDRGSEPRNTL